MNLHQLRPVKGRILVRPYLPDPEARTPSGLILPRHSSVSAEGVVLYESDNPLYANQGEVVAVADHLDEDILPGDWIVFSPYAAQLVKSSDETLILLLARDVLAVVDPDLELEPEPEVEVAHA